jgi:hypothetical protein
MYIMVPEPVSTAYLINSSHQSVCLYVYPAIVARPRLERYRGNEYTRNNGIIVGRVVLYAVRVVSNAGMRLVVSRTSCYYLKYVGHNI